MNITARSSIRCHVSILSGFDVSSIINCIARKAGWLTIQQMKTRSSFLWRWDTSCRILKTGQWSVSSQTARHSGLQPSCMIVIEPVYPMNYKCSCVIFSSPNLFNFGHRNFYFYYKSNVVVLVIVPNLSAPFTYRALQRQFTELRVSPASTRCMATLFTFWTEHILERKCKGNISFGSPGKAVPLAQRFRLSLHIMLN
jgi:hypothetical protein